jgi:hypothetical protein
VRLLERFALLEVPRTEATRVAIAWTGPTCGVTLRASPSAS